MGSACLRCGRTTRARRQGQLQQWRRLCRPIQTHLARLERGHTMQWMGVWSCRVCATPGDMLARKVCVSKTRAKRREAAHVVGSKEAAGLSQGSTEGLEKRRAGAPVDLQCGVKLPRMSYDPGGVPQGRLEDTGEDLVRTGADPKPKTEGVEVAMPLECQPSQPMARGDGPSPIRGAKRCASGYAPGAPRKKA